MKHEGYLLMYLLFILLKYCFYCQSHFLFIVINIIIAVTNIIQFGGVFWILFTLVNVSI